jgi:hypothetical protein
MISLILRGGTSIEYSNNFSDRLADYKKASRVARGEDNFNEMEYYGYLLNFSIHNELIPSNPSKKEEEAKSTIVLPSQKQKNT